VFTQPGLLLLVFAGGVIGTALREIIALLFSTPGSIPWAIFAVNVTGALLLGFTLTVLDLRIPGTERERRLRLFLGTGILGGFTTYSALAVDTVFLAERDLVVGIVYPVGSVIAGLAAAAIGIWLAHRTVGRPEVEA
jgi:CrcB protein